MDCVASMRPYLGAGLKVVDDLRARCIEFCRDEMGLWYINLKAVLVVF